MSSKKVMVTLSFDADAVQVLRCLYTAAVSSLNAMLCERTQPGTHRLLRQAGLCELRLAQITELVNLHPTTHGISVSRLLDSDLKITGAQAAEVLHTLPLNKILRGWSQTLDLLEGELDMSLKNSALILNSPVFDAAFKSVLESARLAQAAREARARKAQAVKTAMSQSEIKAAEDLLKGLGYTVNKPVDAQSR